MAVIVKYIEFLREYNKLLERGSKNVYQQKDTLWLSEVKNVDIIKFNDFGLLFSDSDKEIIPRSLLQVSRPKKVLNEEEELLLSEEEVEENKLKQRIYSFFSRVEKETKKNTSLEFVCAFGLFNIQLGDNKVKVHLFNVPLKASIRHGTIYVGLNDKVDPYIDSYFLNHAEVDRYTLENIIKDFDNGIADNGIEYLQSDEFKELISKKTLELHSKLMFNPSVERLSEAAKGSFISYSPCFILRRKRPRYFQNLMNKIIEYTNENDPELTIFDILLGQKDNRLIKSTPYFSQLYEKNSNQIKHLNSNDFEAFFPLPYNKEQLAIYQNYKSHELSVVTGPPGTGKSHSIVNLLCAILAEGKRVLITAKTDKALESLLKKIPTQFNGLIMANVEQEHSSEYSLSNSIDSIRDLLLADGTYTINYDLEKLDDQKRQYTKQRTLLARTLNKEYERIRVDHLNKEFSLYELYALLKERAAEWEWLKDTVTEKIISKSEELITKIRQLVSLKNEEKESYEVDLSFLSSQLNQIDFEALERHKNEETNLLEKLEVSSMDDYLKDSIAFILSNLKGFNHSSIKTTNKAKLKQILNKCREVPLINERIYTNLTTSELIKNRNKYSRDITTYLSLIPKDKNKLNPLQRLFNSKLQEVKYLEGISLSDSFCDNRKDLLSLRKYIENFIQLYGQIELLIENELIEYNHSEQCNLFAMRKKVIEGIGTGETNLEILKNINNKLVDRFSKKYGINILQVEDLVAKAEKLNNIGSRALEVNESIDKTNSAIDYVTSQMHKFKFTSFENNEDVSSMLQTIENAKKKFSTYELFNETKDFLLKEIPKTTEHLLVSDTKDLIFNSDSFHLKIASKQVQDISKVDIQSTISKLNHYHEGITKLKGDILSGLAKENFKNRFTAEEKNSFVSNLNRYEYAFKQSKRGIKDADKFRRRAQDISQQIAPNVSCWVMKIDDVFQTLDQNPHVFDCVIVDEASQLDFNSLLLGYYTKSMIVVGDEKQTSPDGISILGDALDYLRDTKLSFMGEDAINIRADASLFSLSKMVAGTTNQTLREHFRCVPELIEFSKTHYYDNKIIPLKLISSNRLTPKQVHYVEDAYVIDKVVEKEIKEIGIKLNEILVDPLYDNKSIGVVSLGSANHTRALKDILVDIPQEKLEKHNIVVDNPTEFQGDERDVIIVSLGVGLEVDEKDQVKFPTAIVNNIENNLTPKLRGINVGLSRAKEQMILYHSLVLDELRSHDFRREIISFFYEDYEPVLKLDLPPNVEKSQRMLENRPKPFDSWFEYDVAKELIDNGFTFIVPQYEVKKQELFTNPRTGKEQYVHFKIDLVVYNNGMPVAIECDGDWFHSEVEDVAYDIERQEFLQRIGWKVHRITYSSYRINPKKEINRVIKFITDNTPKKRPHKAQDSKNINEIKKSNSKRIVAEDRKKRNINRNKPNEKTKRKRRRRNKKVARTYKKGNKVNLTPSTGVDKTIKKSNLYEMPPEEIARIYPTKEELRLRQLGLFSDEHFKDDEKYRRKKTKKIDPKEIVENSICKIVRLDANDEEVKIELKNISTNEQEKLGNGIQLVSIFSPLGNKLLGEREGNTIILPIPERPRIYIKKVYSLNHDLKE